MTIERIMGSVNHGLTKAGKAEATGIGIALALKDGLDTIYSSPMRRAQETGEIIAELLSLQPIHVTYGLMPWFLGVHEGKPESEAEPLVKILMKEHPDYAPHGMNRASTEKPESFDDFKRRLLGFVGSMLGRLHDQPSLRIGLVTHSRDVQVVRAWNAAGRKIDYSLDMKMCCDESGSGLVPIWFMNTSSMKAYPAKSDDPNPPGLYFVRHGPTDWDAQDSMFAQRLPALEKKLREVASK